MSTSQVDDRVEDAPSYLTATEAELRRDLAACYRLAALFGWNDLVANHISARLPRTPESFLLNRFGDLFEEVTASSLIEVELAADPSAGHFGNVNVAGFIIHSAVHQMRPDATCIIHLHSKDAVAVSMIEDGLLPLNQAAMMIASDIAYHDYEGPAFDLGERQRLQADLGSKNIMMLRNHGTLVLGRSIAEAFQRCYFLESACTVQVKAMGMGRALTVPSGVADARIEGQAQTNFIRHYAEQKVWPAMIRRLNAVNPGYEL
ncbi:MAG: class II aldolase/adducin family protein [Acidimicrobiia bacterium]